MVHHTASPTSWSGQKDADYCALGDEDAPLSNLYLDRDGVAWILAAGATNTNGKGKDTWGGGVPNDSMNSYAIGIEANGGAGASWPEVQQDAYVTMVSALCRHYGIPTHQVRGHFEWAPDRKVDPAGPSRWATGNNSWDMGGFRNACGGAPTPTPTPPQQEDDDVQWRVAKLDSNGAYYIGDGKTSYWVSDSGGDITMIEANIRMAPGAVNVKQFTGADANQKPMVTNWNDVGKINATNIKKYVGANKRL
jgi:hypothetical protein